MAPVNNTNRLFGSQEAGQTVLGTASTLASLCISGHMLERVSPFGGPSTLSSLTGVLENPTIRSALKYGLKAGGAIAAVGLVLEYSQFIQRVRNGESASEAFWDGATDTAIMGASALFSTQLGIGLSCLMATSPTLVGLGGLLGTGFIIPALASMGIYYSLKLAKEELLCSSAN